VVDAFSSFVTPWTEGIAEDSFSNQVRFSRNGIVKNTPNEVDLFWWDFCIPQPFPHMGFIIVVTGLTMVGVIVVPINLSIVA
jgi:hypothetical protein